MLIFFVVYETSEITYRMKYGFICDWLSTHLTKTNTLRTNEDMGH